MAAIIGREPGGVHGLSVAAPCYSSEPLRPVRGFHGAGVDGSGV